MKPQHSFLFCIIFLLLFTANCIAQNNPDRLLSNDKIWSIGTFDYSAKKALSFPYFRTHYIKFDSIDAFYSFYEGAFYAQLTIEYDVYRSDKEDMSGWYDCGTAWEVDSLQRIYYSGEWGAGLLYDFGAEKGDTLDVYDIHSFRGHLVEAGQSVKYVVDTIDTITIQGVERKRMVLFPPENIYTSKFGVTWISGIGSLNGILFSSGDGIAEDSEYLRCLHQGDLLLYKEGNSPCYYSTVDVPEKSVEDSHVSIYPNPTNDMLYIDSYRGGYLTVVITSLNGQPILSKEMEGISHQLDLSSFQKGVYFITIRSKDFVTTRKIVKL